jgi:hypothetical protein
MKCSGPHSGADCQRSCAGIGSEHGVNTLRRLLLSSRCWRALERVSTDAVSFDLCWVPSSSLVPGLLSGVVWLATPRVGKPARRLPSLFSDEPAWRFLAPQWTNGLRTIEKGGTSMGNAIAC